MPYESLQNLLDQIERTNREDPLLDILRDLTKGSIDINSRDYYTGFRDSLGRKTKVMLNNNYTPLLIAIKNRNEPVARALVENGADACKDGGYIKTTPLMEAIKQESAEIVEFLLKNGADRTIPSAFFYAIEHDKLPFINLLLDLLVKKGANSVINSAILPATQAKNCQEIIKKLLAAGADVNYRNKDGTTLLEICVRRGEIKMVESLVKAGANIEGATSFGQKSPLAMAADRYGNLGMVHRLIELGADTGVADRELKGFAGLNVDFAFYLESLTSKVPSNLIGPD